MYLGYVPAALYGDGQFCEAKGKGKAQQRGESKGRVMQLSYTCALGIVRGGNGGSERNHRVRQGGAISRR
jgi:hypothetical protein